MRALFDAAWRHCARAVLLVLVASAAPALAQTEPVEEGAVEQSCRALAASTLGSPDHVPAEPGAGIPAAWAEAPAAFKVPSAVHLRTPAETFNRRYEFATREGRIFGRNRGATGPWREMPLPACFAGRVESISLDDDEMVALDTARRVFTMDNALKDGSTFNWTSRWGTPFWTGPGYSLPDGVEAWSWSVISPLEDHNWVDPAGNRTAVGSGKVSHIWGLRTGGQRLTFWDPWLPLDESYEMCGPHRGRFKAINLSASGSYVFVIGQGGVTYTRLYDFDISGHDPVFFRYSYEDQRGKGDGSPIQLPAEPWKRHPPIPGAITDEISIHKIGVDALHRIIRVEGEQDGRTGWWERDTADPPAAGWTFHESGLPLQGARLRNTGRVELGESEDGRYRMTTPEVTAELTDFNVYCSPARLRVERGGKTEDLLLHHVDGLRQHARGRGLDHVPRVQEGVLAYPDGRFEPATVDATRDEVTIRQLGWTLKRAPAPRCLPARAALGPRSVGAVRLGLARGPLERRAPGARGPGRLLEWCVEGGGRVRALLSGGRIALVATDAVGHARRGVHPGSSRAAAKRAFPRSRRLGRRLLQARPGSRHLFAFATRRLGWVLVAPRRTIARPPQLRARLRQAGLARYARGTTVTPVR